MERRSFESMEFFAMRLFATRLTIRVAVVAAGLTAGGGCVTPAADLAVPPAEQPAEEQPTENNDPELVTTLFAMGSNTGFVGFGAAQVLSGTQLPATTELANSTSGVTGPIDAVLDNAGRLYILNTADDGSVAVYDNPLTANASRQPDRIVAGDATGISKSPTGIAYDPDTNQLYVSNTLTDTVVFDLSNPGTFNGNVVPVRSFDVDLNLFRPTQLRFSDGTLYMTDTRGGTSDIMAFDSPTTLQGEVVPDRTIQCDAFDDGIGVDFGPGGRMLVGSRDAGQVLIFNNPKALDGAVLADVELTIANTPFESWPSYASIDLEDRLYVADASNNDVYVFDDASELVSGARAANRVIDSEELIAPNRILLFEEWK